jgi:hypothetical protein
MKQLAGGINAQFRANNSTAPQENSQPGAVEQSYRTGRIFGQISVNVDGDISPACVCLGANGGGARGETINFTSCDQSQEFTVTSETPYTIVNNVAGNIVIADIEGGIISTILTGQTGTVSTPGIYIVACLLTIDSDKGGTFSGIFSSTMYIINNTSGGPRTFTEQPAGSLQNIADGVSTLITTLSDTTSIIFS